MDELTAKEILNQCNCSLVSVKNGYIYISNYNGLLTIMEKLTDDPQFFKDSSVADIIVGKAAALLLVIGKVRLVYASIISEEAVEIFIEYKIPFEFETIVPFITEDQTQDGFLLEQKVSPIEDAETALEVLKAKFLVNS